MVALRPFSVAAGARGAARSIEARNAGDGGVAGVLTPIHVAAEAALPFGGGLFSLAPAVRPGLAGLTPGLAGLYRINAVTLCLAIAIE